MKQTRCIRARQTLTCGCARYRQADVKLLAAADLEQRARHAAMQDDLSRLPQSPARKPQHSSPRVRATLQLTTSALLSHCRAQFLAVSHANASHVCARASLGRDLCPWWQGHVVAARMKLKIVRRTLLQAPPLELARAMKYSTISILHAGRPERGFCAHRARLPHHRPSHQRTRPPAQQPRQSRRPIPQPPSMVGNAALKLTGFNCTCQWMPPGLS